MKKSLSRLAMLMLASIGALTAPVPAVSQEYDPCVECHRNCYQAYVVNSNQPATYQLCQSWCDQQYCGDYAAPVGPELLAARLD
ncbi:MAG TPA: hypothetical protein VF688_09115 [Allosphingosinicella sp.]|jgi:hypothetical protein